MASANLMDGYTGKHHPVDAVVEPHRLRLFTEEGEPLDEWTLKGLRLAKKLERGRPVRLAHTDHGRTQLIFDNQAIVSQLRRVGITLRVDQASWSGLPKWMIATIVAVGGLALGFLSGSTFVIDPLVHLVPTAWEESWGAEIIETVVQEAPLCEEAAGQEALQMLVHRLAGAATPSFPLNVHVSNAPVVNAAALPGGQIIIFRGLLDAATTPEEVAGVLAHEMAHQVRRHPTRGVVRKLGVQTVMGLISGNTGSFVGAATGTLIGLSHDREDESEADRIGMEILNTADIRADGWIDFFERMSETSTQPALLTFLSTHPSDVSRIATLRSMARGTGVALTADEWHALKTICGTEQVEDDPLSFLLR